MRKKADKQIGPKAFHKSLRTILLIMSGLALVLTRAQATAQQIPTLAPQAPGGPGDSGQPVLIAEGAGYGLTGAYTTATKLYRDPTDPQHATEPQTGRNFHWDSDTNMWVNSATGLKHKFLGYLCSSEPSPTPAPGTPQIAQGPQTPQPPGGPEDSGGPVVVPEAGASATGAFTTGIVLWRNPTDPQHATEPQTGRNFHWDSDANMWVNSATGMKHKFWGYVCSTPTPSPASANPGTSANAASQPTPPQTPPRTSSTKPASPSSSQTSMGTTGAGIQFQLRGFGGASFVNGDTPATAGFDGAVLFPLGNHILIGPTAGFQWINGSIVNSIGSQQPGSTFIHTSADFKQGNFGGSVGFPFGGFQLGIQGGATVANSTITQQSGFCGLGNATSPAGCTVFSTTTTHDTITGPFVGGYISHSIFSHVGVFAGYNYHFGLKDTKPNATNPTGPPVTVLNLHYSDAVAGITLTLGGNHEK